MNNQKTLLDQSGSLLSRKRTDNLTSDVTDNMADGNVENLFNDNCGQTDSERIIVRTKNDRRSGGTLTSRDFNAVNRDKSPFSSNAPTNACCGRCQWKLVTIEICRSCLMHTLIFSVDMLYSLHNGPSSIVFMAKSTTKCLLN